MSLKSQEQIRRTRLSSYNSHKRADFQDEIPDNYPSFKDEFGPQLKIRVCPQIRQKEAPIH